jgi:hypothetical protein
MYLDIIGTFYEYEETSSEGLRENYYGLHKGDKCIITVTPTSFELRNIDDRWQDKKGDQGLENGFYSDQLRIEKRVIREGFFIFKKNYYIFTFTIIYNNSIGWKKFKHTFKVDATSGNNILSIVGKN